MGLIEIDPITVEEWRAWGAVLMGHAHGEALETLKEENLDQEHVFLVHLDEKYYLCFFTEGAHLPTNLERKLNKDHAELLARSRIRKITGEELYSLKRTL